MRTIILIVVLVALLIAAIGVKVFFFRSVNDAWFVMDRHHLPTVPPGLVVFRPTHFHDNFYRVIITAPNEHNGRDAPWVMGRDLPLRVAIAVAYGVNRGTVVLPADASTNHFDFLVTTLDDPSARLQAAIRHKLGLVAQKETRETAVLAMKVTDPNLSRLAVSGPAEPPDINFKKGELYFTHIHISELTDPFERALDTPVVDETGLTNSYDFSVPFDREMGMRFRLEATSRATIDKMLNAIGLTLQPDNAPVELLVVRHL